MMFQSSLSKCMVVCCVSLLLGLAMARAKNKNKGRCDSLLTIPSDYYKTSLEESEGSGNLHTRSLSPWSWKHSTIDSRIPPTIWEANCTTMYCSYPNSSQELGFRQNSVPIYRQVLVLTATQHGKCYRASFLSVTVGCTCVFAKTS